jgi:hypothetical protein
MLNILVKVVVSQHIRCSIANNKLGVFATEDLLDLLDGLLPGDVSLEGTH